jgi:hypothetical protein
MSKIYRKDRRCILGLMLCESASLERKEEN